MTGVLATDIQNEMKAHMNKTERETGAPIRKHQDCDEEEKEPLLALSRNDFSAGTLCGPVYKLVGGRWRPCMLVLESHPEEGAGGKLWWYSETDGAERPKASILLEHIRDCVNSFAMENNSQAIEGSPEDFQIPAFDVLTTSGRTHCFRVNSKSVQARVFCSLDNIKLDRVILTEHGTWMSSIQKTSRLATRLQRERQAIGAVASGIGDQGLDQGKERGGQTYK